MLRRIWRVFATGLSYGAPHRSDENKVEELGPRWVTFGRSRVRENRTLGSVGANAKWLSDPITPPDEVLSVLAGTRRGVERLEAAACLRRLVTPKDSLPHCGMASANRSRTACRRGPCLRWRRRPIASSIMRGHARASIPDQLTARDGEDQRRRNRSEKHQNFSEVFRRGRYGTSAG